MSNENDLATALRAVLREIETLLDYLGPDAEDDLLSAVDRGWEALNAQIGLTESSPRPETGTGNT